MLSPRSLLVVGALALVVGGCNKNKEGAAIAPAAGADPVTASGGPSGDKVATPPARPDSNIEVLVSVSAIDDMMSAVADISRRIDPDDSTDLLAQVEAMLLASGFAPTFLSNVDLAGTHAFWGSFPADGGGGAKDIGFAASVAVVDGRKVIDGTPSGMRPQPLGDGVWEFRKDENRIMFKEAGKELLVAASPDDLEHAPKLLSEVGSGRRIRARATNIPLDDIDPLDILDLPSDFGLGKKINEVFKELKAVEFELELGTKNSLELLLAAEAPFSKLGLAPLGSARAGATALEKQLPANPLFVTSLSYGDPKLVHKTIDSVIPLDQIPAPFGDMVKRALEGTHALLDQIADDVVLALYVDSRGRATLLIAANVKSDSKATQGLRTISDVLVEALEVHAIAQGKNTDSKFAVDFKNEGVKLGGVKADRLLIKVPKAFKGELTKVSPFMKGSAIEAITFTSGKLAVVAIGAGARSVSSNIAKSLGKERKSSLAEDTGLKTLRSSLGGCQVCVSFDMTQYLRLRLTMLQGGKDKAISKSAKSKVKTLARVKTSVDVSGGVRLDAQKGTFAFTIPAETMSLSAADISVLRAANDFVQDPEVPAKAAKK